MSVVKTMRDHHKLRHKLVFKIALVFFITAFAIMMIVARSFHSAVDGDAFRGLGE